MTEKELILNYMETNKASYLAEQALEVYFMPLMRAARAIDDTDLIDDLIRRCPAGSVTWTFLMDARREYYKKKNGITDPKT